MLLRLDTPRAQLRGSELSGDLEFFPFSDVATVDINETPIALESEPSVALAETLVASQFWKRELATFLGHALGQKGKSQLSVLEPYRKGRIPVVFVHGTGSSSARWADMANDLLADPRIHEDFHFWFYNYDSGNPITYSAYNLRKSLTEMDAVSRPDRNRPLPASRRRHRPQPRRAADEDDGDRLRRRSSGETGAASRSTRSRCRPSSARCCATRCSSSRCLSSIV